MQGTQVWSLVWEDPTCRRPTKPVRHNYWAHALEPTSHNNWACVSELLKRTLEPVRCNYWDHTLQLLKPVCSRARVLQLLSPHAATTEARTPTARAPQQDKPPQWEACTSQWRVAPARRNYRKPAHSNEDPTQPKNNNNFKN